MHKYPKTKTIKNLEEVIQIAREIVDAILKNYFDRAERLNNLKISLENKYSRIKAIINLKKTRLAVG